MSIERLLTGRGIVRYLDQTSAQPSLLSLQYSPNSSDLNPHHFVDISTELLHRGYSVCFRAPGNSMHPTISNGELITVKPVAPSDLKRRDIILYRLKRGVIAHRLVRIRRIKGDAHYFILRGDASGACDYPVETHQVLGKVTSVNRGGSTVDLYSRRARMLLFVHAWVFRLKRWMIRYFLQVGGFFH